MRTILLRWAVWAGVFQLVGTVLTVWGLKVTTQTGGEIHFYGTGGPPTHGHAAIVREHPWAVTVGI